MANQGARAGAVIAVLAVLLACAQAHAAKPKADAPETPDVEPAFCKGTKLAYSECRRHKTALTALGGLFLLVKAEVDSCLCFELRPVASAAAARGARSPRPLRRRERTARHRPPAAPPPRGKPAPPVKLLGDKFVTVDGEKEVVMHGINCERVARAARWCLADALLCKGRVQACRARQELETPPLAPLRALTPRAARRARAPQGSGEREARAAGGRPAAAGGALREGALRRARAGWARQPQERGPPLAANKAPPPTPRRPAPASTTA